MSLNDELAAIEAAVTEYENGIASGEISVDAHVHQIRSIADPNAGIAKAVELSCVLRGYIENINLQRMRELKYQYPNDSRIRQLANRVAECYLKLMHLQMDMAEALASPDVKLELQAEHPQLRNILNEQVSDLVSP